MRGYQREVKSSENKDYKKEFKLYEVELREYQKEVINLICDRIYVCSYSSTG